MVHIKPRVSLGFPSAMSSFLMLTNLTWKSCGIITGSQETQVDNSMQTVEVWLTCLCLRKSRAICTFCSLWKRIRPFSRGCKTTGERSLAGRLRLVCVIGWKSQHLWLIKKKKKKLRKKDNTANLKDDSNSAWIKSACPSECLIRPLTYSQSSQHVCRWGCGKGWNPVFPFFLVKLSFRSICRFVLIDNYQAASTVAKSTQDKVTSEVTAATCTDAPRFKLSATTKLF